MERLDLDGGQIGVGSRIAWRTIGGLRFEGVVRAVHEVRNTFTGERQLVYATSFGAAPGVGFVPASLICAPGDTYKGFGRD